MLTAAKGIEKFKGVLAISPPPTNSSTLLKFLLLELCITEAKCVRKHPNSLILQKVPIEEFEQTFDYGLYDVTKLDDFNQVVDWQNSYFHKQAQRIQIKA